MPVIILIQLIGVPMSPRPSLLITLFSLVMLAGCDRLGLADPAKDAAIKEADARATGSACRHAGRAIEDCYSQNADLARSAVYAGWREMNDYMRENKMAEVRPESPVAEVKATTVAEASTSTDSTSENATTKPKSSKK
jgi:hypothetical protein